MPAKRLIVLTALLMPLIGHAESASDIIDRMIAAEKNNNKNVGKLFVRTETLGHTVPQYFEWDATNNYLRLVPFPELFERQQGTELQNDPVMLRNAANEIRSLSGMMEAGYQEELAKSGLAGSAQFGLGIRMAQNPPKPWLTSSPGGMMNLYADFLEAAARAKVEMEKEKAAEPGEIKDNIAMMNALKGETRVFGDAVINGRARHDHRR